MSIDRILIEFAGMFILFGVPIIVIAYPKFPRWPRSVVGRFVATILVVWFLLIVHRLASLPTLIRDAEAAGNMMYDGVGGNVAILVMGWFMAAIGCVPALILATIIQKFGKKDEPHVPSSNKIEEAEQAGTCDADEAV
jgi:hypothetical protein